MTYLLCRQIPPDVRISTSCIEETKRAIICNLDSTDVEENRWKLVQSDGLEHMAAEEFSANMQEMEDDATVLDVRDNVRVEPPGMPALELAETADILKPSISRRALQGHWIHVIDSGGQYQFMEVLPAFIRNVSLIMPVFKLSDELCARPSVEYFSPDGKVYQLGDFSLSGKQLLSQIAQLSLFHHSQISLPNVLKEQVQPRIVAVGTFRDHEESCKESRSEKNEQLKQVLQPFKDQLICRSTSEIFFPVNATSAGLGDNEDRVAFELRSVIQKFSPRLRIRLPLQWYFLELQVRKAWLGCCHQIGLLDRCQET